MPTMFRLLSTWLLLSLSFSIYSSSELLFPTPYPTTAYSLDADEQLELAIRPSPSAIRLRQKHGSIRNWLGPGEWWAFQNTAKDVEIKYNVKWKVEQMGVNETIFLKKLPDLHNVNTCYELRTTELKFRRFCYPSIMVTGYPKCGTSAIFDLLISHPSTRPVGSRFPILDSSNDLVYHTPEHYVPMNL